MQQAAGYLVGEHDFRNFCKMDVEHVLTFRLLSSANMEATPSCVMHTLHAVVKLSSRILKHVCSEMLHASV